MATNRLFVVATPIGNLEDISVRAAKVLANADLVAAEDTRSAATLLAAVDAIAGAVGGTVNAKRRVVSLFDGNEEFRSEALLAALSQGQQVALISEAGTPLVSDPGARVVGNILSHGFEIEVVPGPTAAVAALVASGLPSQQFLFLGFPPRDAGPRQAWFGSLRQQTATMIFYEAPDRVATTCLDLAAAFGDDRRACLSRELTKKFEQHIRLPLAELAATYAEQPPRGECTLVVAGADAASLQPVVDITAELRRLLASGLGPKDAAAQLMVKTGKPRRELYQLALSLARTQG